MSSLTNNRRKVLIRGQQEVRGLVNQQLLRAMRAYRDRDATALEMLDFQDQLGRSLLRGAVTAHMLGVRSVLASTPARQRRSAAMSFDELLKVLQSQLDMDVRQLERQYQTDVLRVAKNTSDRIERNLRLELADLIKNRVSPPVARQRFADRFNQLGLTGVKDHQVEAIFNTQAAISYHAGQWNGYQAPEVDEILWGYKYVTVGDGRVRLDHVAMDETTLPKDDPWWLANWPPNGWNCRCEVVPIFSERPTKQPKPVEEPDKPPRMPEPDPGFKLNSGKVYPTAARAKVSPHAGPAPGTQATEGKPPPPAQRVVPHRRTEEAKQIIQEITTRPRSLGPQTLPTADRETLEREVRKAPRQRRRATHYFAATVGAVVGWRDTELRKGDKFKAADHVVGTKNVQRAYDNIVFGEDVVWRLRAKSGDRFLLVDEERAIFSRNKEYRVVSRRRARIRGRMVEVITIEWVE